MKSIHERLHAVMEEIDYVQKEKKAGMSYSIVSHDAVTALVRPVLVKHRIAYYITNLTHGQDGNRTWAKIVMDFVNIDDNSDKITVESFGYGVDAQDKGPGKAMSYAVKYALLKTLGLETGDEPDEVQDERADHKPSGRPTWEPDKPGAAYKGSILIHPGTPPGKSGNGPSAYSVKDSSVWKQLDAQTSLDELDAWYAKKETQDEKSRLPWGHQVELFERVIKRGADVAESVPALMAFLDGYDDQLKALKEVDGVRYQSLVEHVLIARKAIKERSSENVI